jgi:hypothetical protein
MLIAASKLPGLNASPCPASARSISPSTSFSRATANIDALMSSPIHVWSAEERIAPERPLPEPISRIREGEWRFSRERARWVISDRIFWMREFEVYWLLRGSL